MWASLPVDPVTLAAPAPLPKGVRSNASAAEPADDSDADAAGDADAVEDAKAADAASSDSD